MALTKVQTGGLADDSVDNTILDVTDDFAFTGTVSGAGLSSPLGNTVTVTGEGGSNTSNLAQSLAKAWINLNGNNTPSARDSFNISSISDRGTGQYDVFMSNAMNNSNWCASEAVGGGTGSLSDGFNMVQSQMTTTEIPIQAGSGGSYNDFGMVMTAVHGDLA